MLLNVVFAQTTGKPGLALGPFPGLRIEGEIVRDRERGEALARHTDHHWLVGNEHFFRLDIAGPVKIRFVKTGTTSQDFGPFEHFSCADGIAYADREFFATLAETTGNWHCIQSAEDWPAFEVLPA
jgi:hypothetical protein